MQENNKKQFKEVTQRFCPNLDDNAIIVRTGETYNCLSQSECKNCKDCEHKKEAF